MNEYQQYGQPQFGPQSLFGGIFGAPLGAAIGRGIGGIFGNPNLGGRIGEIAGGIGGGFLPFSADPVAQQQQQLQQMQQLQQLQQQQAGQLTPQGGFFGGLVNQFSRPVGNMIGNALQQPQLGGLIGSGLAGLGSLLPFNADPAQLQQLQQMQQLQQLQQAGQLTPQGGFFGGLLNQLSKPLTGMITDFTGTPGLAPVINGALSGLGNLLPFGADAQGGAPQAVVQQLKQLQNQQQQLQQALQQVQQQAMLLQQQLVAQQPQAQGQMAPQGWLGNMISQYAQPVGGFIGSQLGNQGLGSSIGGFAGQLGRMLPFSVDPWTAYQAQQAQQAQLTGQQTLH